MSYQRTLEDAVSANPFRITACLDVEDNTTAEIKEAFNKLRNLNIKDIESCKGCECFNLCPGGCRAKAYMKSGDLLGPSDPLTCSISKKYLAKLVAGELNYVWE